MRNLGTLGAALVVILALSLCPLAIGQAPAAAPAAPTLERDMSTMNRAYRTIKANASDKSKNDATLAALAQMEQATLLAKDQTPDTVAKLSGDEKTKQLNAYREMIAKLLQNELALEQQILAGDNDKTAATIAAMDELQKSGHAQFRKDD